MLIPVREVLEQIIQEQIANKDAPPLTKEQLQVVVEVVTEQCIQVQQFQAIEGDR